jgi:hypothetical protein
LTACALTATVAALGIMAVLFFLIFTAIGIGPALALRKAHPADLKSWLLAPAVGFVLISIAVTALVDCQLPIEKFAMALAVVALIVSAGLIYWRWQAATSESLVVDESEWTWAIGAVLVGTVLVALPVQIGGWWFNHFRGNGWDSYNYVTMTGALVHEPMNWLRHADVQALLAKNGAYPNASGLLQSRWTTSALLGWLSCLTGMRYFVLEPAYGAMHLMLAMGPVFLVCRGLGAPVRWAFVITILVTCGFDAQFSLDLRSLSQLNSFPILMLILAVWPDAAKRYSWNPLVGDRLMLLLAFGALGLDYIELVPMILLGLIIASGMAWFRMAGQLKQTASALLPAVLGVGLAAGLAPVVITFFGSEAHSVTATDERARWLYTQHGWLASAPHTGFWGLTHLDAGIHGWWSTPVAVLTLLIASVLTALLLMQLWSVFTTRSATMADFVLAGVIVAGLAQAGGMLLIHQYWAAVKGVGYVAPFCLLAVIAWWVGKNRAAWAAAPVRQFFSAGVGLFAFSQGWAALLRIVLVASHSDYLGYIYHLTEYGARDLDVSPIRSALAGQKPTTRVGLMIPDVWMARMARLEFGWDWRVVEPLGVVSVDDGRKLLPPVPEGKVDFWIFQREALPASVTDKDIVAKTPDFILTRSIPFLIDMSNPNGVEQDPGSGLPMTWVGNEPATFRFNSPVMGTAFLAAQYAPGPSIRTTADRHIEITPDTGEGPRAQTVNNTTMQIPISVKAGVNVVRIVCTDRPELSEQPNGDRRPLLLGVVGPQLRVAE